VYDQLKRFEKIIFDTLSVLLVLFYSYAAVVQPASTQYHRGIYVIITYMLVFLLYKSKNQAPAGGGLPAHPAPSVTYRLLDSQFRGHQLPHRGGKRD
jgi:TRAP-type uncharacterized transport system fused permease subunit